MSRGIRRAAAEWSVVLLGIAVLAVTLSHPLVAANVRMDELLLIAPPAVLSLFVIWLGLRARADGPADRPVSVTRWCLLGGVGTSVVAGWLVAVQSLDGSAAAMPIPILTSTFAVGAAFGGVFGLYYDRLNHRTEQLARQNDRLDEFAGIVSHDLRNPLNVAQGHVELARETGDAEHFDALERAHRRMERLIGEILSLARQGEASGDPEPVELDATAAEAWSTVATDGATLQVRTETVIEADPQRLRALLENLFRNAVQHGGDEVAVTLDTWEDGFAVADDGPGIPDGEREQVFEGGYSTAPDGTGLGLAIVRRIAEAHGWSIEIVGSEAGGARFEFGGVDVAE